jgi:hypothetical protein
VIELKVAVAISSISESTAESARPTGVRSPGSRRSASGSESSSNIPITSISVSRRALPAKR